MDKAEREKLRHVFEEKPQSRPAIALLWNSFLHALDHIDALEQKVDDFQRERKNIHSIMEQNAIYDGKPQFINDGYLMHLLNYHSFGGTLMDYDVAKQEIENPRIYKTQIWIAYEDITKKELSRASAKAAIAAAPEQQNKNTSSGNPNSG